MMWWLRLAVEVCGSSEFWLRPRLWQATAYILPMSRLYQPVKWKPMKWNVILPPLPQMCLYEIAIWRPWNESGPTADVEFGLECDNMLLFSFCVCWWCKFTLGIHLSYFQAKLLRTVKLISGSTTKFLCFIDVILFSANIFPYQWKRSKAYIKQIWVKWSSTTESWWPVCKRA